MDYTVSDANSVHTSGRRMHQSTGAVPTEVSARDMNQVIWSLMHLLGTANVTAAAFNPDDPNTFNRVTAAVQAIGAGVGNVSQASFTGGNQHLSLSTEYGWQAFPGGLILQWATGVPQGQEGQQTVQLQKPLTNGLIFELVSTRYPSGDTAGDAYFEVVSTSGLPSGLFNVVVLAQSHTTEYFGPITPRVLALGF